VGARGFGYDGRLQNFNFIMQAKYRITAKKIGANDCLSSLSLLSFGALSPFCDCID
jgi:hypothetical protein